MAFLGTEHSPLGKWLLLTAGATGKATAVDKGGLLFLDGKALSPGLSRPYPGASASCKQEPKL